MGLGISLSIVTVSMFVIAVVNRERYLVEKDKVKKLERILQQKINEEIKKEKIERFKEYGSF